MPWLGPALDAARSVEVPFNGEVLVAPGVQRIASEVPAWLCLPPILSSANLLSWLTPG